jgi:uncharacterized membrane-anchored protein YitT (DUF2179 family)
MWNKMRSPQLWYHLETRFSSCNGLLVTVGMLLLNISPNNLLKHNKIYIVGINPLSRMIQGTYK